MDEKTEKNMWEELKLLQPIIDKFDKVSLQVKAWFITAFTAVAGFSMTGKQQKLLCRNFVLILLFYFAEAAYRAAHNAFLERNREIQLLLRGDRPFEKSLAPPNLDKYLKPGVKAWGEFGWSLLRMAGQPRAAIIYWLSVVINILLLYWFV